MITLLAAVAHADIAPTPPDGRTFLTHAVRVEGLDRHPGYVVLAYDQTDPVRDVAAWKAGGAPTVTLANGASNRRQAFSAPMFRLLPAEAYAAWRAQADAAVAAQREACQRGEGCPHISWFVPKLPPPSGTIDCGLPALTLVTEGPAAGPDSLTSVFTLTEATPTTCVLVEGPREQRKGGTPIPARPTGNCDHLGGAASVGAALAVLLLATRRRQK